MPTARSARAEDGQASVELVALLPLIAVLAGLLWQGVVAGQAVWLAGSAARAAARARRRRRRAGRRTTRAAGPARARPRRATRWARRGVRVGIVVPAIVGSGRLATVSARARLQDQGG